MPCWQISHSVHPTGLEPATTAEMSTGPQTCSKTSLYSLLFPDSPINWPIPPSPQKIAVLHLLSVKHHNFPPFVKETSKILYFLHNSYISWCLTNMAYAGGTKDPKGNEKQQHYNQYTVLMDCFDCISFWNHILIAFHVHFSFGYIKRAPKRESSASLVLITSFFQK